MNRHLFLLPALLLLSLERALCQAPLPPPAQVIGPDADSLRAPHGRGNVYAPDLVRSGAGLRMWFGGQGRDGHDRIHLAVSADGLDWEPRGVVLEDPTANHCNDPSVVEAGGVLFMFYTRAAAGVTDQIAVATSRDGVHWEPRGTALAAGGPGTWDSLSVGRPSVLFAGGLFRMWYDGRKDLPPNAPDPAAPKSPISQRHVGYATSRDGLHWERHGSEPVYDHDAGGVHVLPVAGHLAMLAESRQGTEAAISADGLHWKRLGLLVKRADSPAERHGHVTPFLLADADNAGATFFYGAASAPAWDANSLCRRRLSPAQWLALSAAP